MRQHPSRFTALLALAVIVLGTLGQAPVPKYSRSQYKH